MSNRTYLFPDKSTKVVLHADVLNHIYAFAQTGWLHKEAGGQIFSSSPHLKEIVVTCATGPHLADKRSRHNFVPDAGAATADRIALFAQDLHAVGLWHTHPEPHPSPSKPDHAATLQYLKSFEGEMHGFLLLILGNQGRPLNLSVWLATEHPIKMWQELHEVSQADTIDT